MNSYNPFAHQIQLNLNTGETKQVNATGVTTARQYFGSLTTLNKSAHIYGCVYLATPDALLWFEQDDDSCPTCGEDGGTSCGAANCGLLTGEPE